MASYATPADMKQRYDWNTIADLVSDSSEQLSAGDLETNAVLLQLLADASGDVEAALLRTGRYTLTDLTSLPTNSLGLLKRITCELVIAYLFERRPLGNVEVLEHYQKLKEKHLADLASGKTIFDLSSVLNASTPVAEGLTTVGYQQLNLLRDRCTAGNGYFPARVLPNDR